MGLACSVLGHRYGEREHIEERDRQGSEEIIAIREVKTCDRCGEELVVSETKEVVAIDEPESTEPTEEVDEPAPEPVPEPTPEPDEGSATADIPDAEAEEADEGVILREPDDREPGEWHPAEDDESEDEASSEEVVWPDPEGEENQEEPDADDPSPWPDVEGEDEGFDASEVDGDPDLAARIIESTGEGGGDAEQDGFLRADEIDASEGPDEDAIHTEFFCPQCDWNARTRTTSVRRGDICPECRSGYIGEREV